MIIGNRKDAVYLQLHSQVSRQPKRCRSAMLDPKSRAFCCISGSLYFVTHFENISSSTFVFGRARVNIFQLISTALKSAMFTSLIDAGHGSANWYGISGTPLCCLSDDFCKGSVRWTVSCNPFCGQKAGMHNGREGGLKSNVVSNIIERYREYHEKCHIFEMKILKKDIWGLILEFESTYAKGKEPWYFRCSKVAGFSRLLRSREEKSVFSNSVKILALRVVLKSFSL